MGWTYLPYDGKAADFVRRTLTWEDTQYKNTCLDVMVVKFRTAYAAVERVTKATGEREVWAAVVLLDRRKNDYYNFGYKDMDESMGPCEDECPERILSLLTPTDSQYALAWRERCWRRIRERASKPRLKVGQTVKFSSPLSFTDGSTADTFEVERGRGSTFHFRAVTTRRLYRIGNYREREYTVLG